MHREKNVVSIIAKILYLLINSLNCVKSTEIFIIGLCYSLQILKYCNENFWGKKFINYGLKKGNFKRNINYF